jgi:hypothetical protein
MNRIAWLFVVMLLVMTGCGDTKWFPENIKPADTPTAFTFVNQTDVAVNATITSAAVTITGIKNGSGPISITGGTYSINGGAYTSSPGTVNNNDSVTVQQTSGSQPSQTVKTTLTVGSFSADFSSTTISFTFSPTSFTSLTNQLLGNTVPSNVITITGGATSYTISVSGGSYSLDGAAATTLTSTVQGVHTITAWQTTSNIANTSVITTIFVNTVPITFQTTTGI